MIRSLIACIAIASLALSCGDSYVPSSGENINNQNSSNNGPDINNNNNSGGDNNQNNQNNSHNGGGDVLTEMPSPTSQAPALNPSLVALTYLGGEGDQFIRELEFVGGGQLRVAGEGFEAILDTSSGAIVSREGELGTHDSASYGGRPPLPGDPGKAYQVPSAELTLRVGYRQAGRNLQTTIVRAFRGEERIWALWGHSVNDITAKHLGADSRCYQAWAMPSGRVGVQCWTDGGNSVLAKEPRDLDSPGFDPSWARGAYQRSAGGMSSMYALIEPRDGGSVLSGTFIARHVSPLVADPWGRTYVAATAASRSGGAGPSNPFGQDDSTDAGFFVLDPSLKDVIFNARIGGSCGQQRFGVIALKDNLLALGGTTCAADVATVNAAQSSHGGGQDGLVAIIRLW